MRYWRRSAIACALCCLASSVGAQGLSPDSLRQLLDGAWSRAREAHTVPGAVVAIVKDGQVAALRGFGFANVEDSVPADPERSVYRLASVAKLFVASVVMQLADSGMLHLDRPIDSLTPLVRVPRGEGIITLHHLLTHTAGFDERVIGYAAPTRDAMRPLAEYLADRIPDRGWPAGHLVGYSNYGMALAAYAAEVRAATRFDSLAARMIFTPLGMTRSWYVAPADAALEGDVAPPYRCGASGCERRTTVWSHLYPVGLAFSTAADMSRFMVSALASPDLTQQRFTHDEWLPGIASAFFLHEVNGRRVASHAGGAPGAATLLVLVPGEQLGVFIATNAGEPGFTNKMFRAIVAGLLPGRGEPPPTPAGPVSEYAGSYLLTRYAHRTIERLPAAFAFTARADAKGDTLLISNGSETRRFVRVDSLKLREVDGDGRATLTRDASGRIAMLYTGVPTGGSEFPGAFERVPWYRGASFLNEYLSWLAAGPTLVWAAWLAVAVVLLVRRRVKRVPGVANRQRRAMVAIVLAVAHSALTLAFVLGFVATSGRDIAAGTGILFGLSTGKLVLLRTAWVIAILAIPLVAFAIAAWRRGWWSWFGRASYSVIAVAALAMAHFLVWWNYVPGRW